MSSGTAGSEKEAVEAEKGAEEVCCANCGIAQVDDINLEECNDCDLVKYCGDKCRGNHKEQHEEECKQRKAKLHDKELFEQPDGTHLGECPICFLPLPIDLEKSTFCSGCCKLMCNGCIHAYEMSSGNNNCPFCREPAVKGEEQNNKRVMKRVKVNDPAAIQQIGVRRYQEGDYLGAVEYFRKAAELGDAVSHYNLGSMYYVGKGVEKDEEKAIYHYEKAAIGGHPGARHVIAVIEGSESKGNNERAVKHLIIAANLGHEESMKKLWGAFKKGFVTKEELEATLRTHKAAIDATKSAQRDAGEAYHQRRAASASR
jgi:tetratricopeptide (TPR) repeat protein